MRPVFKSKLRSRIKGGIQVALRHHHHHHPLPPPDRQKGGRLDTARHITERPNRLGYM